MQMDVLSARPERRNNIDDFVEFFFGRKPADTDEAVFTLGPWHGGELACNRRVDGHAVDAVALPHPVAGPMRIHQRQIVFHPARCMVRDAATQTAVSAHRAAPAMIPAEV